MEYNLQLLHEICLQENWGFPVLFFCGQKRRPKVSSSPCWTRKAALGNCPVDCCNRRGFAAAKRVQQGEPKENWGFPVLFFWLEKTAESQKGFPQ